MRAALFAKDPLWPAAWAESTGEATLAVRMEAAATAPLTLYSSWFCPFAQRAWIAAEEKGVDYRWVEVNPYAVDETAPGGYSKKQLPLETKKSLYPGFVEASPRGLVPAIDCGGELLCESDPIIEYIDGKFPSAATKLCPDDPHKRALCRVWADFANAKIQRPYYRMLVEQTDEARAKAYADLLDGIREFAGAMGDDGPYFLGADFSFTDVSFAPFFQRILWVGAAYRGISLPQDDPAVQRMLKWWDAVSSRDSVKKTLVCKDRLVASYANYAENKATSDYAKSLMSSLSATTRDASALSAKINKAPVAGLPLLTFVAGLALGAALLRK
eukprot:CAMPEP_0198645488 /NCGR_PEP_ID=MMETSP1467-20131203/1277_1 /TAXON_ID=1462469 /ORGANISM="unid. sp., Strain CCMP2135" /LENGTH=328 /DNA_ID=CAMNT_0044380979 /DNA_START=30 /DNA_END=1016 /DNA_ORIENTATION=+